MELDGRVAVVTGGGTGIGRAVCVRLAKAGASAVVVNYSRSEDDAHAAVHEIEALGANAQAHKPDVSDERQFVAMNEDTVNRFGGLDNLANNSRTTRFIPHANLDETPHEVWNETLAPS